MHQPKRLAALEQAGGNKFIGRSRREAGIQIGNIGGLPKLRLDAKDRDRRASAAAPSDIRPRRTTTDRVIASGASDSICDTFFTVGAIPSVLTALISAWSKNGLPPVARWHARQN